jgi:response regulator RpfG family c-di-GMP phosphodiesterase
MMPGMSGYEVCEKIKGDERYRNIPVIMITGLMESTDRIRGIKAGAEEFLSKPFNKEEMFARIKMLLKFKAINDELNSAYHHLSRLVTFGEDMIRTFNPLGFDFISNIDNLVGQLTGDTGGMMNIPAIILVRVLNDRGRYDWYRYEFVRGKLERSSFDMDITSALPDQDSQLFFCNEDRMRELPRPFSDIIGFLGIAKKNMICHISDNLSLIALNYERDVSSHDATVLRSIVMQTLFLRSLSVQVRETEDAFAYTVHSLARASEVNDEDTGKHIYRVGHYCALLAEQLGMPESYVRAVRIQSALHDVGKIHIPASVLKKPGELTREEWSALKEHPRYGAKIIGGHPRLELAKSIALTHHERWDGSGYPEGLRGEDIPLAGRLMAIADQYDALRNARIYKTGLDHLTACEILTQGDGARTMPCHFDPQLLELFGAMHARFEEVYDSLQ